jgi:hypothetical protein
MPGVLLLGLCHVMPFPAPEYKSLLGGEFCNSKMKSTVRYCAQSFQTAHKMEENACYQLKSKSVSRQLPVKVPNASF